MPSTAITSSSSPDYDDWGWDDYWSCEDWVEWHKKLKEAFGKDVANYKFIAAFQKQTFGAAGYECRTFNAAFRQYARDNDFYEALFQGIGILAQPIGWAIDLLGNVGEVVTDTTEAASNVSNTLKKLLPLLLFLLFIGIVIYGYQKYIKTA